MKPQLRKFFTDELLQFLAENEVYHIESNGEALMIFKYIHIARTDEVQNMLRFAHNLLSHMHLQENIDVDLNSDLIPFFHVT